MQRPAKADSCGRRLEIWAGLLVGAIAFALYRHTLGFGFVHLDDDFNIVFNPQQGAPNLERLRWMFTDVSYVRRYLPLGWLMFAGLFSVFGLDGAGYHLAGTLLFALDSVLVYVVLRLVLVHLAPKAGAWGVLATLAGALWWVVSPLRAETVAWASGLLYGQALAFALAAAIIVLVSFGRIGRGRGRQEGAAALLYLGSILTYPMALGLAPALVIFEAWWLRRQAGRFGLAEGRMLLGRRWPMLAAAALGVILALFAQTQGTAGFSGAHSWEGFSILQRFEQGVYVFFYYVWKSILPTGLSPIYGTLIVVGLQIPRIAASLAALAVVIGLMVRWPRVRAALGPWLLAYFAIVFPVLGFTELPYITYDRYALLPSLVLAGGLVMLLARCPTGVARRVVTGVMAGSLVVYGVAAQRQAQVWAGSEALYARIAAQLPGAQLPVYKYRRRAAMLADLGHDRESRAVIEGARALYPDSPFLLEADQELTARREHFLALNEITGEDAIPEARKHLDFANGLSRADHAPEAYEHLRLALALSPGFEHARFNSALILLQLNRPDEALHAFLWSVRRMKHAPPPRSYRGFLLQYAEVMDARGEPRLAAAARIRADQITAAR